MEIFDKKTRDKYTSSTACISITVYSGLSVNIVWPKVEF